MAIYDYTVKDRNGNDVPLSQYKGKVMLIVNTATGCGFTPQYEGLENLWKKFHDRGLEILDFPCNQFANQAPGTEEEIVSFCQSRFGITFRQFAKTDVNGENESPLFAYLKKEAPEEEVQGVKNKLAMKAIEKISSTTKDPGDIKWNFTKFLVDREGRVIGRFAPTTKPEEIDEKINEMI